MKQRILVTVFLVFMGLVLACRDLTFREPGTGDGGTGPEITLLSPVPPNVVPLSAFVSLRVEDVTGVGAVVLRCGPTLLQTWAAAPYQANVDLTPCRSAVASDGGGDLQTLVLTVDALNAASPPGASTRSFPIQVDASVAALTLSLPPRVAPGARLQIGIQSDRDLKIAPVVNVDGTPLLDVAPTSSGRRSFVATLAAAPGLGIDLYDAGSGQVDGGTRDIPYEVLTQVERPLPVTFDATATSGHVTHVEAQVLLSRIAWDVQIPGLPMEGQDPGAWPVATDAGLQLPIALDTSYSAWFPGFLSAAGGAYVPFNYTDPDPIGGAFDGGFQVLAIDAVGHALVIHANASGGPPVYHFVAPGADQAIARSGTAPVVLGQAFTRVGQSLCQETVSPGACGTFNQLASHTLTCVDASQPARSDTYSKNDHATGISTFPAGSGGNFLGIEQVNAICKDPSVSLFLMDPQVFSTDVVPLSSTSAFRLLPVGDGSFAISVLVSSSYQAYLVDPGGNINASAYALPMVPNPADFPGVPWQELLAVRPDRGLIRIQHRDPTHTTFELYPADGGSPTSARLPGYFDSVATLPSPSRLPVNVVMHADGSFSALLLTSQFNYAVVTFDANLRPRWVYKYPRFMAVFSGVPQLAGGDGSLLYLVDPGNGYAVAFPP